MTNESTTLAARPESGALDIDLDHVTAGLKKIKAFQAVVRKSLVPDHDYGTIPGTMKPTLWKPGAEKLCKLLGLADSYIVADKIEDWKEGFFFYQVTCELRSISTGDVISQGLGSCNSKESRYRYRWCFSSEVPSHVDKDSLTVKMIKTKNGRDCKMFRVENSDPFSQANTILKMSRKRAMVDAVLSAGRLSDIFSQSDSDEPQAEVPEQTLRQRRDAMLAYFSDQGVTQQQVFDLIGVTTKTQITIEHLAQLKVIAENIKTGSGTIEDFFGGGQTESTEAEGDVTGDPAERKAALINEILSALPQGDSIKDDAVRLRLLKETFGLTIIEKIAEMPEDVLASGLTALKEKVSDAEAASELDGAGR